MIDMKHYFKEIVDVIQSTRKGMALTWKHAWDARKQRTQHNIQDETYFAQPTGIATLQYPHIEIPTPDNGRYQLHNEMDDCIVCDKCVKVCPVDCIDIEPIKATGLVGHASDGSPIRLYAAKFDIDMSKCCFCGLCTTVCPTECLTMTSEYDFSVFEVKEHNFSFANLTAEEAEEKKRLYEQFVAEKEAMKQAVASPESLVTSPKSEVQSPKSEGEEPASNVQIPTSNVQRPASSPKPAFKPSFKAKVVASPESLVASPKSEVEEPTSNVQRPASEVKSESEGEEPTSNVQSPTSNVQSPASEVKSESEVTSPEVKKPAFKPSFKPKSNVQRRASEVKSESEGEEPTSNVQSPTSNP
jgi:NADH-quinone oxidoreductase subunit I